jgi:hypothetical protein
MGGDGGQFETFVGEAGRRVDLAVHGRSPPLIGFGMSTRRLEAQNTCDESFYIYRKLFVKQNCKNFQVKDFDSKISTYIIRLLIAMNVAVSITSIIFLLYADPAPR